MRDTAWTNTASMLADEFAQIYGERPAAAPIAPDAEGPAQEIAHDPALTSPAFLSDLYRDFHAPPAYPRSALCLSGGGIRSAAFALGIIQFLAKADLLHHFEYLSTVSGGGYTGSWLSAWLTRAGDSSGKGGYGEVQPQLSSRPKPWGEPPQIANLRRNINYLALRRGVVSTETWTAAAIRLRNILVTWILLVPLLGAAAVMPQILSALTGAVTEANWAPRIQAVAVFCYFISLIVFNGARPRWRAFGLDQSSFLIFCLLPLILSAAMWTISMAHPTDLAAVWRSLIPAAVCPFPIPLLDYVFLAITLYASAILISAAWNAFGAEPYVRISNCERSGISLSFSFARTRPTRQPAFVEVYTEDYQAVAGRHYFSASATISFLPGQSKSLNRLTVPLTGERIDGVPVRDGDFLVRFRRPLGIRVGRLSVRNALWDALIFVISGACFGIFLGVGDLFFRPYAAVSRGAFTVEHHLILSTLAVPWLLSSHFLTTIIFAALTTWLPRSREEREWIARAGGWVIVVVLAWVCVAGLVLVVPYAAELAKYFRPTFQSASLATIQSSIAIIGSAVAAVSAILTVIVGGGRKSGVTPTEPQNIWRKLTRYIWAPLFLISLFAGLAFAIDHLALGKVFGEAIKAQSGGANTITPLEFLRIATQLYLWAVVPAVASVMFGMFIGINQFSLHEVYRNRLVRAFLNLGPHRELFSLNESIDDLPMSRLWIRRPERPSGSGRSGKYPVSKSDWRPFHVINIALNHGAERGIAAAEADLGRPDREVESFVVTPLWCGSAEFDAYRRASEYAGSITLGTAMAISGAAASPNIGYNSSPVIRFVLTFFNARLGWWLGNPRRQAFMTGEPRMPAMMLLLELFGLTNEKRKYVSLSDGGHFENLGLYEMVRRRCHLIIVSDASYDPECAFADLGNAVRRISIDLGVRIVFPKLEELRVRNNERDAPDKGGPCYTVGRILYSEVDQTDKDGYILYLKPGFRGDEPPDIVGYAAVSEDFPHEATADEDISSSQFESYRYLGFSIMERAHNAALQNYNAGKATISHFRETPLLEFFESLSMKTNIAAPPAQRRTLRPRRRSRGRRISFAPTH